MGKTFTQFIGEQEAAGEVDLSGFEDNQAEVYEMDLPEPENAVGASEASLAEGEPATPEVQEVDELAQALNVDPATLAPELQAIYKNMQAGFTRKTQEIAAFREAWQDIPTGLATVAREVAGLMNNPPALAQYLLDQAQYAAQEAGVTVHQLLGVQQPEAEETAEIELDEYASDNEVRMAQELKGLRQQVKQLLANNNQQSQQQPNAFSQAQFEQAAAQGQVVLNNLKTKLAGDGITVTDQEFQQLTERAFHAGVRDANSFEQFIRNWDAPRAVERAKKAGQEEGRREVAQKVAQQGATGSNGIRSAIGGNGTRKPAKGSPIRAYAEATLRGDFDIEN